MAVIIGDYQYDNFTLGTCTPTVVDKTKTSYANVPTSIVYNGNTYYIRSLKSCFEGCSNLVTPPSLPPEAGSMERCFYGCSSMTTPPVIPNAVNNLSYCFCNCSSMTTAPDLSPTASITMYPLNLSHCFEGCSSITQAPTIPSHTTNMLYCFARCESLESAPSIPLNVTDIDYCFFRCSSLTTPPQNIPSGITTMLNVFNMCTNLTTAPSIPSGVTNIGGCFLDCSSLTNAPDIPASVTRLNNCFGRCTLLNGNITVYGSPSFYENTFQGTSNDIYIINGAGTSAVETTWKTIASGYSNVHYEADDNQIPSLSFTVTRVSGMASEVPSENGEYAFINATAIMYETYMPDGWSCVYDAGEEDITKDSATQSPNWTRANTGNVWTLKCWLALGDTTKHTFTLQVADEITDENDNVKASQLSTIITQSIPKAYKLVDYYHDPITDTEGMSVGKFATDANLFDVDMPTLFRDTLSLTDGNAVIRQLFDFVYPVGSYYETSKSQAEFDPNVVWGGTWELEASGQVHVSAGTGYSVNGALTNTTDGGSPYVQEHSHSYTAPTLPAHVHSMGAHTHASTSGYYMLFLSTSGNNAVNRRSIKPGTSTALTNNYYGDNAIERGSVTGGMSSSVNTGNPGSYPSCGGSIGSVNGLPSGQSTGQYGNMQPYIVVNRWHRTA